MPKATAGDYFLRGFEARGVDVSRARFTPILTNDAYHVSQVTGSMQIIAFPSSSNMRFEVHIYSYERLN
jgi:hypothetical protein